MTNKNNQYELYIPTSDKGTYKGLNVYVTVGAKLVIALLIAWAIFFPDNAGSVLNEINSKLLKSFNAWYLYVMAFYFLICVALAIWPAAGKIKLGKATDVPEFSTFSWLSMMFSCAIGSGMLTFATGEPLYHFVDNPDVIKGLALGQTSDNVINAYKWSFLHWGFSAWACYALIGLVLAYFCYKRDLPLTIRSALTPLFGNALSGHLGNVVDVIAVIATILGVAISIGFGVSHLSWGMFNVTGFDGLLTSDGSPAVWGLLLALIVVMVLATLSAISGVRRGIKWLSNINMGLSIAVLAFFVLFGSPMFATEILFQGLYEYIATLPQTALTLWTADGTEVGDKLAGWQGGWTILYWAWWAAFAPFVGLFLARISKGRTIREFVCGTIILPSLMCFIWFTLVGGTAIDLELSGQANGAIVNASLTSQLYETINIILSPELAIAMSLMLIVLMITYLVTTADSAILIINTINAAGNHNWRNSIHIVFWGVALTLVIGSLIAAGGLTAIKSAMIIGALPFSFILALMGVSLVKAIVEDVRENSPAKEITQE